MCSHVFMLSFFRCVRVFADPMDCSLPGSSAHGIFQARILERVAISLSRGSSQCGIKPTSLTSPVQSGRFFSTSATCLTILKIPLAARRKGAGLSPPITHCPGVRDTHGRAPSGSASRSASESGQQVLAPSSFPPQGYARAGTC